MILKHKKIRALLLCVVAIFTYAVNAQTPYEKKTARLMTVWGENLQATDSIWPEYPRPQMVREQWLNLNGIWQFQPAASANEALPEGNLSREIMVPFPVESALSGIMEHYDHLWYRRSFTLPAGWEAQKILLHFEAVDYACEAFVNGVSVGKHEGGYDPFYFDITEKLNTGSEQILSLRVTDMTDDKGYPRGKQTLYPGGIMYTSTSGIWQTVWLEAVPKSAAISRIRMVPNIDNATLNFSVEGDQIRGKNFRFKIYDHSTEIADITQAYKSSGMTLDIPKPLKLWSPDDPFLYDMKIYLLNEGTNVAIDSVSTYFGMRKISKRRNDEGYWQMTLNNKFLFQIGPLDQGFWPDGIYTAPCDEALRYDIEKMKDFGFNMVRKHIKVEPLRWYYWCDKLGLLVWQDMPSMNSYIGGGRPYPTREESAFRRELEAMIKNHWNSPAIISWVLFNEWQGSHAESSLVPAMQAWDDSRLINVGSGGPDFHIGDIFDWHSYPSPTYPRSRGEQVLVCGEYGGVGYYEPGHIWEEGNPYETVHSYAELLNKYTQYAEMLIDFKSNRGLSAAVYTEITDVEMELNGLMTYDRKVIKGKEENFHAVNQRVIDEFKYYTYILPTSEDERQSWKYVTTQPASGWRTENFDDSSWNTGLGGFGSEGTPGAIIGTEWKSSNIWLRRTFVFPEDTLNVNMPLLRIHHDDDCEVYINGILAVSLPGYTGGYAHYDILPDALEALKPNEENTIAVHCRQNGGGQFIDAGISRVREKTDDTALKNVKKKKEVSIRPNPVSEKLFIELEEQIDGAVVEICDMAGKTVKREKLNHHSVDVSALSKGMYFLKLKTNDIQEVKTFIKE